MPDEPETRGQHDTQPKDVNKTITPPAFDKSPLPCYTSPHWVLTFTASGRFCKTLGKAPNTRQLHVWHEKPRGSLIFPRAFLYITKVTLTAIGG